MASKNETKEKKKKQVRNRARLYCSRGTTFSVSPSAATLIPPIIIDKKAKIMISLYLAAGELRQPTNSTKNLIPTHTHTHTHTHTQSIQQVLYKFFHFSFYLFDLIATHSILGYILFNLYIYLSIYIYIYYKY